MDPITNIIDRAKEFEGWQLIGYFTPSGKRVEPFYIRNLDLECPIAAAHRTLYDFTHIRNNNDWEYFIDELDMSEYYGSQIVAAADNNMEDRNYNPFLRDRLCLELVGAAEAEEI